MSNSQIFSLDLRLKAGLVIVLVRRLYILAGLLSALLLWHLACTSDIMKGNPQDEASRLVLTQFFMSSI